MRRRGRRAMPAPRRRGRGTGPRNLTRKIGPEIGSAGRRATLTRMPPAAARARNRTRRLETAHGGPDVPTRIWRRVAWDGWGASPPLGTRRTRDSDAAEATRLLRVVTRTGGGRPTREGRVVRVAAGARPPRA